MNKWVVVASAIQSWGKTWRLCVVLIVMGGAAGSIGYVAIRLALRW